MKCGTCTMCCYLPELHEVPSPIDTYCRYCEPGIGCKIQSTKPEECRQYQCMWSQMDNVGAELRPDKCNIIFDRIADDVICARMEENSKINALVMGQIRSFNKQGFSIIIFRGKSSICFLIEGHTECYVKKMVNNYSSSHSGSCEVNRHDCS